MGEFFTGVKRGARRLAGAEASRVFLAAGLAFLCSLQAATPADYRQKIGVYAWGKLAGGLAEAAQDIKKLGPIRDVRVAMGPSWDPSGKTDASPLDVKIRRSDYRAFLAAFPVVMITAYDAASLGKYKSGRLTPQQIAAVKDEFRRFTLELARTRAAASSPIGSSKTIARPGCGTAAWNTTRRGSTASSQAATRPRRAGFRAKCSRLSSSPSHPATWACLRGWPRSAQS